MDKPWKVVLAFLGVFVAGAVFGGVFALRASGKRLAERPPEKSPPAVTQPAAVAPKAPGQTGIAPALMRQFTQKLSLTTTQREKIRPLVNRSSEDLTRLTKQYKEMQREHLESTTRVMERMYDDVSAWLTQDQRKELEEMRRLRLEKLAEERRKRGELSPDARKTAPTKAAGPAPGVSARKSNATPSPSTNP